MKNFLKKYWPSYFGAPTADHIDAVALAKAQAQLAALLNDRDLLDGQIAGYKAIVLRLKPTA
jgi:hypothetical protein